MTYEQARSRVTAAVDATASEIARGRAKQINVAPSAVELDALKHGVLRDDRMRLTLEASRRDPEAFEALAQYQAARKGRLN